REDRQRQVVTQRRGADEDIVFADLAVEIHKELPEGDAAIHGCPAAGFAFTLGTRAGQVNMAIPLEAKRRGECRAVLLFTPPSGRAMDVPRKRARCAGPAPPRPQTSRPPGATAGPRSGT